MITKALSVRAPWWWFILHGGKGIENRSWPTNFRGTVYIHASKWWQRTEIILAAEVIVGILNRLGVELPTILEEEIRQWGGHIVGHVDIVDCVSKSDSPWFFGEYGFVLANPVAFEKPVPCKGMQLFFTVPDDVLAQLRNGGQ